MILLTLYTIFTKVVFLTLILICALYLWFQYKFSYWSRKGVPGPKPVFPFGNIKKVIKRKAQFFEPYCETYRKYKHLPYVGIYSFHRPVLCVNDPEIAKLILIKDFDYFQAHGIFSGGAGDLLAGHMFNVHGDKWRHLRSRISPTFSPGKLKSMYSLVHDIADNGLSYVEMLYSNGESINFTEFYAKYAMEIVASVGFGVECNGFKKNTEFYLRGREYFEPKNMYWTVVRAIAFLTPDIFKYLNLRRINPEITDFFYTLVDDTVGYRKENNFYRNDFLQTMIELKDKTENSEKGINSDFVFTFQELVSNTVLYLFAGYETSATAGQFAAFELAVNPDIQRKARQEILRVLAKYKGECSYEAQNEMTYMNMVLDETMRKYPPMRALFRRCTKDYKIPDHDVVIEKGTMIFIPCHAIHMDPNIFPDPEKFDPERFTWENKLKLHPCHWMPFGEGPRKCLGLRQGYIQSKMALVKILQNYELQLDRRTQVPIKIKASNISLCPQNGIWIKLKKID